MLKSAKVRELFQLLLSVYLSNVPSPLSSSLATNNSMFPLLPLLFVDVTTILLIVEPDGTDVLLIVKEPRAEVATVSFVPKKEFNIPTECRDDPEVNAVGVISNVIVFLYDN